MHKGKSLSTFHEIIHPIIVLHYNAFMLTNVTRTVNSQLIPCPTLLLKMYVISCIISNWDSRTSSGSLLQLCKVLSVSVHLLRRILSLQDLGQTDGRSYSYIPPTYFKR